MFKVFKSKEEREQAKADKEIAKMQKQAAASAKINDALLKREAAESASKFQKELDNKRRVYKAEGALKSREEDARASLIIAISALQQENSKEYPNPIDQKRCEQRVKNYFFELVTIKRAQRALDECKLNNQWDRAMGEMSNTFKLMREAKSGSNPLKKMLFFYRYKRVEGMGNEVYGQVESYFGSKAKPLPEDVVKEIEGKNPIDLMISDKLFDNLIDAAQIDSCLANPDIVTVSPDEAANYAEAINERAVASGEPEIIEGINKNSITDDDFDKLITS